MTLFLNQLFNNCQHHARKTALEFIQSKQTTLVSYEQLEFYVASAASYLQSLGLESGDRVAIQLPKSLDFVVLHLAAMRLGAVSLPLNPAFPAAELEYFLKDSEAKVFFTNAAQAPALQPMLSGLTLEHSIFIDFTSPPLSSSFFHLPSKHLPDLPNDPNATALMIYTSGTTGRPKGAELTHENLTAGITALHDAWAWQEEDVLLHVLPIFHTHGLMVALHGALHAGATAVILDKFDAQETLKQLMSKRFSVFMAVPTIHGRLLDCAGSTRFDLSHMRLMTSGSARLPDDFFAAYQKTFKYTLLERYGMSETGMNLSNPYSGERRVGSVGLPLPGVSARVVDPTTTKVLPDGQVGEVQIKGNHVFKGYWRQAEKTAESFTTDGWLRTGDLGERSADGYYTLKGRSKDLIISGGFNVYPPEVELVLSEHSSVAASAVIACPDKVWGERVVAIVELKLGEDSSGQAIIDFCRERLANYKTPKQVHFIKALPRNAMGKIQKATLRTEFCSTETA